MKTQTDRPAHIFPAPIPQLQPKPGAHEINMEAELRVEQDWSGIDLRHTVFQKPIKRRVIAMIVFKEVQ